MYDPALRGGGGNFLLTIVQNGALASRNISLLSETVHGALPPSNPLFAG